MHPMRWVVFLANIALIVAIQVYFFHRHSRRGFPKKPDKIGTAKNDLYSYNTNQNSEPEPTATPVSTATAVPSGVYVMRVNANGVSMVSTDGRLWAEDKPYFHHSYGYVDSTLIANGNCAPKGVDPEDYLLYDTIRYSREMDYKFDLPKADTYHVNLYFNECHHSPGGSRQTKILLQGNEVDQFDLVPLCVSQDGTRTLLTKSYDVVINQDNLTLDIGFQGVNDNAEVSAIQVTGTQPVKGDW